MGMFKSKWLQSRSSSLFPNRASGFSTPVLTSEEIYSKVLNLQDKVLLQVSATSLLRKENLIPPQRFSCLCVPFQLIFDWCLYRLPVLTEFPSQSQKLRSLRTKLRPAETTRTVLTQLLGRLLKRRNKQQIQMVWPKKKSTQRDQLMKKPTQNLKFTMSCDD